MFASALCLSQSSVRALSFLTAGQESVVFVLWVLKHLKVYFSLEELYLIHFFVMQGGNILRCLCFFEVVFHLRRFHLRRLSHLFFFFFLTWQAAASENANVLSLTFNSRKGNLCPGLIFNSIAFSFILLFLTLSGSAASQRLVSCRISDACLCLQHRGGDLRGWNCPASGLGADSVRARPPLSLGLAARGHVKAGGVGILELWLLALLFLFKNRLVGAALLGWVPCSLTKTGDRRKQPQGRVRWQKENLPRCSVRAPGPQLQAATISIPWHLRARRCICDLIRLRDALLTGWAGF